MSSFRDAHLSERSKLLSSLNFHLKFPFYSFEMFSLYSTQVSPRPVYYAHLHVTPGWSTRRSSSMVSIKLGKIEKFFLCFIFTNISKYEAKQLLFFSRQVLVYVEHSTNHFFSLIVHELILFFGSPLGHNMDNIICILSNLRVSTF